MANDPGAIVDDSALRALVKSLQTQALEAEKGIYLHVMQAAHVVRNDLRRTAPKGSTKRYSHGWRVQDKHKNIASFSIYNPKHYGVYIEGGVIPGNKPWSQPGPRTVQATRQGNLRIWSRQAVGGTVTPYITDAFTSRMTRSIINIIMDNLKSA